MEKLAKHLYEAYCEHTGWKSAVTGHPLPKWDDVAPAVREAWHAAAKAAAAFSLDEVAQVLTVAVALARWEAPLQDPRTQRYP
jgi:hypothetical protein